VLSGAMSYMWFGRRQSKISGHLAKLSRLAAGSNDPVIRAFSSCFFYNPVADANIVVLSEHNSDSHQEQQYHPLRIIAGAY